MHPLLRPHGGGQAVAAWALQALRDDYAVTLVTWESVDLAGVNRVFGTCLRPGDFEVRLPDRAARAIVATLPGRSDILRTAYLLRLLADLDRAGPFDAVLGTHDEMDFGRRGIQYVHFPWAGVPPPARPERWFHRPGVAVSLYRRLCAAVWPASLERMRDNVTLVNSSYIRDRVWDVHGIASTVVHPPVPGGFGHVAWDDRQDGIVCLGRIAPIKQLTDAVAIVDDVRGRGHAIGLHIIGTPEDAGYEARLRARAATRPWMHLHLDMPRHEMAALMARQRYGLHAQVGEHFGIAVAELVRAGCVTFVAVPGGPEEIVGHEAALTFETPAQAADRIDRVLRDPVERDRLRAHVEAQGAMFSEARFIAELRVVVGAFLLQSGKAS